MVGSCWFDDNRHRCDPNCPGACSAAEIQGQPVALDNSSNLDPCMIAPGEPGNYNATNCTCNPTSATCSFDATSSTGTVTRRPT